MQHLVTDRAHFKSIIESNSLYIDKTEFVYKIASSEEKFFLLNRPRRFGKSLFVNTLKSFYQGEKELFAGLDINNQDWQWEEYPVIHLDFCAVVAINTESLDKSMGYALESVAGEYDLKLETNTAPRMLKNLILKLYQKFDNHWFNSGSPRLLFHLIQREDLNITGFEDLKVEKSKLNPASIKELTLIPFMYQTGYLTIKEILTEGLVRLDFPNFEVKSNFLINLLDFLTDDKINLVDIYYLRNSLVENDEQQFRKYLNSIIDDLKKVEINQSDSVKEFYQQIFYLIAKTLNSLYLKISSEVLNTKETVEFKVKTEDNNFLLSFNYGQNKEIFRQLKAESETEKDSTYISINFDLKKRDLAEVEIKN